MCFSIRHSKHVELTMMIVSILLSNVPCQSAPGITEQIIGTKKSEMSKDSSPITAAEILGFNPIGIYKKQAY